MYSFLNPGAAGWAWPRAIARPLLLGLLLVTGCSISYMGQEVQLALDPAANRAELLLIYKGVGASDDSDQKLQEALQIATAVLAGRRDFEIKPWGMHFDLDGMTQDLLEEEAAPAGDTKEIDAARAFEMRHRALRVLGQVSIEEVGAFLDSEGRLCAFQRLRLDDLHGLIDFWNRQISDSFLEELPDEAADPDSPLDARSIELLLARAASGAPWIRLVEGGIELDFPVTRATADRIRAKMIEEVTDPEQKLPVLSLAAQHLVYVDQLDIGPERTIIHVHAPGEVFHFATLQEDAVSRPALREALERTGALIDSELGLEEVRNKLDRR